MILPIVSNMVVIYCVLTPKKISSNISAANFDLLQQDLNNVFTYYLDNNIPVSIGKCQCINFTCKKKPILFQINNVNIEWTFRKLLIRLIVMFRNTTQYIS